MKCTIMKKKEAVDVSAFLNAIFVDLIELKIAPSEVELTFISEGLRKRLAIDELKFNGVLQAKLEELFQRKEERIRVLREQRESMNKYLVVEKELKVIRCICLNLHKVETNDKYLLYRGTLEDVSDFRSSFAQFVRATGSEVWEYFPQHDTLVFLDNVKVLSKAFGYKSEIKNVSKLFLKKGYVHEDYQELFSFFFKQLQEGCENLCYEMRLISKHGMDLWVEVRGGAIKDRSGGVIAVFGSTKDITKEKLQSIYATQISKFLFSAEELSLCSWKANFTKDTVVSALEHDVVNHQQVYSEEMLTQIMQYAKKDFRPELERFLDANRILQAYKEHDTIVDAIDYHHIMSNGEYIWVKLMYYLVDNKETNEIEAHFYVVDINEEKLRLLRELRMKQIDTLTGLSNQIAIKEIVNKVIIKENLIHRGGAMLLFDINHFAHINSLLGEKSGNQILVTIAKRLRSLFRESDIVSRVGGDEFLVVCMNMSEKNVKNKAMEICNLMQKEYKKKDEVVTLTMSSGVAMIPRDGVDFDSLYKSARISLYAQKSKVNNEQID